MGDNAGLKIIGSHQGHGLWYDAPLIGLNVRLKNHCLALSILVPFLDFPICTVIKECALEKSGLAQKITPQKSVFFALSVFKKWDWGGGGHFTYLPTLKPKK